ncbi:DUF3874 domain-containing protein [Cardinium endosymbiont of Culicoides punctatus]|uniref:DUF3874 domain-containing protein n=1 Tax=Cardinium endosymbiont of Culicoides punctatus TaxID=2304601 RepID=UPI001058AEE5|nr:DUF3874 domain-containing protein [Cardinium endosymbiont of Culicoides punctatus]TDG94539.1 hypothetical protein CCPUN_07960 [Cardinium endosymbiont of Culicoides punctatus]
MYKLDVYGGELTKEELEEIKLRSNNFQIKSSEEELVQKYLSPSNKEEGEFMTTTDILQYLQEHIGTTIRLNRVWMGRELNKLGFKRVASTNKYGYFARKI